MWWRKRRLLWKTLRWLREIFRPCTVDLRSEKSTIYGTSTGWRLKCKIKINVFRKKINGPAGRVNTKNFKFVDFLGRRGNICLIHKYTSYFFFHFCPLYSLACHHETMKLEATVVAHWGWGYTIIFWPPSYSFFSSRTLVIRTLEETLWWKGVFCTLRNTWIEYLCNETKQKRPLTPTISVLILSTYLLLWYRYSLQYLYVWMALVSYVLIRHVQ